HHSSLPSFPTRRSSDLTQQFVFPVITPLMLAIYVGFISVFENPNGPIAVGFSLFPLTSPIVMMMRLPNGIGDGGVPWWQLITSIDRKSTRLNSSHVKTS